MNILLTGATGYIGKRLLPVLTDKGHHVYTVVRDKSRYDPSKLTRNLSCVTVVEADLLDQKDIKKIPKEIDAAYYLVHAMSGNKSDFQTLEDTIANNFVNYLNQSTAKQCIYLSGIVNDDELSSHLESRLSTENILKTSDVPLTVLRAAIIIGSGSASFEIIRDLAEKLPFMIAPKWINTKCQPIGIRNVINYLDSVLRHPKTFNQSFDIGGPDILTYKEMLLGYARQRGIKRWIFSIPLFTPRLSSYWLYFVTSTSYSLATSLVESMKNEVIAHNDAIKEIIPQELLSYTASIDLALGRIEQNTIISSWKDALVSGNIQSDYMDFIQVPDNGTFKDKRKKYFPANDLESVEHNMWSIGGNNGWYCANGLWKIRGFIDKLFGGVGLRRGRRDQFKLSPGDPVDFWRVLVADKSKNRILLFAEMKLPGEAWLEFNIRFAENNSYYIEQCATFRPKGIWGRLYWYLLIPLHNIIFPGTLNGIVNIRKDEKQSRP